MIVDLRADGQLVSFRPQLRTREVALDGQIECGRPDLERLSSPPAPFQRKAHRSLTRDIGRSRREPADQNALGLTAHVLLELPGLRALADEQHKALNLAVPVLVGAQFCQRNLARQGL